MTGRRGFSLVEMVIVLVLAGIVSTAAISMLSTQNRLNEQMAALGESQENARSAVEIASSEIRSAAGDLVTAHARDLAFAIPVAIGVVCATAPGFVHVYLPLEGDTIDLRRSVDRKAFWDGTAWNPVVISGADRFGNNSYVACTADGDTVGRIPGDYASLRGNAPVGTPVALFRYVSYHFAESALNPGEIALVRRATADSVELATGFSGEARFEYQVVGDTAWLGYLSGRTGGEVGAVRIVAAVAGVANARASAPFTLVRDVRMRNAR